MSAALFWIILSVALFIVEGVTVQLICIWFAFGALFAMLASFIGAPLWVQLLIFLVSSLLVLVVGRPIFTEKLSRAKVPTNADRVIGQVGVVLETIDNARQSGRVKVDGLTWTARSEQGPLVIPEDSRVVVRFIDGVKLIVLPLPEDMPRPTEAAAPPEGEQKEE